MRLGPAQVHAQQHVGPVLRLGTAGAAVDLDDGVLVVLGAGEFELELEIGQLLLETRREGEHLVVRLTFGDQLLPGLELGGVVVEALDLLEAAFELAALLQQRRALRRLVPESRHFHLPVDVAELFLECGVVKDTPGDWRVARQAPGA